MSDSFYLLLLHYTELNNFNSFFSNKRDNSTPLLQRNILRRTVVGFPGLGWQRIQIEAVVDGHVTLCQQPGYDPKRLLTGKKWYFVRIMVTEDQRLRRSPSWLTAQAWSYPGKTRS